MHPDGDPVKPETRSLVERECLLHSTLWFGAPRSLPKMGETRVAKMGEDRFAGRFWRGGDSAGDGGSGAIEERQHCREIQISGNLLGPLETACHVSRACRIEDDPG
jgi:hypothetical protein